MLVWSLTEQERGEYARPADDNHAQYSEEKPDRTR